ncbi:YbaK/EbsC family protein [Candidatus Woesearchaeota archaeon]|nr:YbaK/EbsC family protein [Candidatus Woesearchaeota archaeon]
MDQYEEKLKKFIRENKIEAKHLSFKQSCHSVEEAARVTNTDSADFVKNICLIDTGNNLIVAIVKGEDRVSITNVAKALNSEKIRIAEPEDILQRTGYPCGGIILQRTGYPCGGIPSFGYTAIFLIDPQVMEKKVVYSGGGSENSLIKIATEELQRANNGKIVRIRK